MAKLYSMATCMHLYLLCHKPQPSFRSLVRTHHLPVFVKIRPGDLRAMINLFCEAAHLNSKNKGFGPIQSNRHGGRPINDFHHSTSAPCHRSVDNIYNRNSPKLARFGHIGSTTRPGKETRKKHTRANSKCFDQIQGFK